MAFNNRRSLKKIDAHIHILPDAVHAANEGYEDAWLRTDLHQYAGMMDALHIEKAVIMPLNDPWLMSMEFTVDAVHRNLRDMKQKYPGKFYAFADVDTRNTPAQSVDALLHAIADALLGASGLGDIGSYFPPEEKKWKDADSRFLLKQIWTDVKKAGWSLNNLDCVIEIEKPKILPWRQKIIASIAEILETETSRVFVKAKTNEKLDAVGSENAVKTYCTCLLMRQVQE